MERDRERQSGTWWGQRQVWSSRDDGWIVWGCERKRILQMLRHNWLSIFRIDFISFRCDTSRICLWGIQDCFDDKKFHAPMCTALYSLESIISLSSHNNTDVWRRDVIKLISQMSSWRLQDFSESTQLLKSQRSRFFHTCVDGLL